MEFERLVLKGFCNSNCHLVVEFGIAGIAFKEQITRFESFHTSIGPGTVDNRVSAAEGNFELRTL